MFWKKIESTQKVKQNALLCVFGNSYANFFLREFFWKQFLGMYVYLIFFFSVDFTVSDSQNVAPQYLFSAVPCTL